MLNPDEDLDLFLGEDELMDFI